MQQDTTPRNTADLCRDLATVLNSHSAENGSNAPDFILAEYLVRCLDAYDEAVRHRAAWYGRMDTPGGAS